MRDCINYTILSLRGYKGGIFTPDMLFRSIVEEEIQRLTVPIKACADMVMDELVEAARSVSKRVSTFALAFILNSIHPFNRLFISDGQLSRIDPILGIQDHFVHWTQSGGNLCIEFDAIVDFVAFIQNIF